MHNRTAQRALLLRNRATGSGCCRDDQVLSLRIVRASSEEPHSFNFGVTLDPVINGMRVFFTAALVYAELCVCTSGMWHARKARDVVSAPVARSRAPCSETATFGMGHAVRSARHFYNRRHTLLSTHQVPASSLQKDERKSVSHGSPFDKFGKQHCAMFLTWPLLLLALWLISYWY